jgi:hypothetical protein
MASGRDSASERLKKSIEDARNPLPPERTLIGLAREAGMSPEATQVKVDWKNRALRAECAEGDCPPAAIRGRANVRPRGRSGEDGLMVLLGASVTGYYYLAYGWQTAVQSISAYVNLAQFYC